MRKAMGCRVFLVIASVLLAGSLAMAQGKDKGRGGKPPGWHKGEKRGWQGSVPPGVEKKGGRIPPGLGKEEQAKWKHGSPTGWSRGDKEGWKGADMPPGLQKQGERGKLPPGLRKGGRPVEKGQKRLGARLGEGTSTKELRQRFEAKKWELQEAIQRMQSAKTEDEKKQLEAEKDRIEQGKNALEKELKRKKGDNEELR